MKDDRDRCLQAGMDGFVSKPIQRDKLRKAIEDAVLLIPGTAAAEPPNDAAEGPMDVAAALARVDGDRVFMGEMALDVLGGDPASAGADPGSRHRV